MTIETLRLLECLLEKPVEGILDSLVLKHLVDRKYFKQPAVTNGQQSETQVNGDVDTSRDGEAAESMNKIDVLDRIELEKIVNRWATEYNEYNSRIVRVRSWNLKDRTGELFEISSLYKV